MQPRVRLRLHWRGLSTLALGLAIAGAAVSGASFLPHATWGAHVEPIRCEVAPSEAIPAPIELEMLGLINEARAAAGAGPVALSEHLMRAASWKVLDESNAISGPFGHTDTLGRSPFQRAVDCGYRTLAGAPLGGAGENISTGYSLGSVTRAHAAFMSSPGHRANLLSPNWIAVGIAFVDEGSSDKRWVTIFGSGADENPLEFEPPEPLVPDPAPEPPAKNEVVIVGVSADGP